MKREKNYDSFNNYHYFHFPFLSDPFHILFQLISLNFSFLFLFSLRSLFSFIALWSIEFFPSCWAMPFSTGVFIQERMGDMEQIEWKKSEALLRKVSLQAQGPSENWDSLTDPKAIFPWRVLKINLKKFFPLKIYFLSGHSELSLIPFHPLTILSYSLVSHPSILLILVNEDSIPLPYTLSIFHFVTAFLK